jgi:nucleotide-binding universal stress UspA family protein
MNFHKILVPVDFSEHSARALEWAINLAKASEGEIYLLHSHQMQPIGIPPYQVTSPIEFEKKVVRAAGDHLEQWATRVTDAGLVCHPHLTPRLPIDAIQEYASGIEADLIVIGTRGCTGLPHALLGSVAERTVRTATCPVVTTHVDDPN